MHRPQRKAIASQIHGLVPREVRTSSVVHLPCAPASVAFARRVLSDDLKAVGVFDHAVGDAVLVVSELVSNAILHAYPLPGERLKVAWIVDNGWLELAVSDGGSATMPQAGHPTAASVDGRGLAIVAHVCQTWGVRTDEVGVTVWAILPAPGRGSADQRVDDVPGRGISLDPAEPSAQRFLTAAPVSGLKVTGS
jgi:anti-sigma regulatory factor (Ser/Thr protein kinase)